MIRVFGLFCKLNLINLSAHEVFLRAMLVVNILDHPCSFCSCTHPDWQKHASYERYLISFEHGHTVTYVVTITRYKCPSCGHTHAILPEHLIPYSSYSLPFILTVLRDYYTRPITVEKLCSEYGIAVSTLYAWHSLFLTHKKLWLGLLEDYISSPDTFLSELLPFPSWQLLNGFFTSMRYSFLQSGHYSFRTARSVPP
jgi:transposase-like protein